MMAWSCCYFVISGLRISTPWLPYCPPDEMGGDGATICYGRLPRSDGFRRMGFADVEEEGEMVAVASCHCGWLEETKAVVVSPD
ncbi:hypothetical protein ACLOJK_022682 [Asimina triloba]